MVLGPLLYRVARVAKDPFLWIATGRGLACIFTGKLFTGRFNIIHAGCALDQPTIGKWLIWFSVLAAVAAPLVLLVRRFNDRSTAVGYWTFAILAAAIIGLLWCVVIQPVGMLVQYVFWMGFTAKRVVGLLFGLAALILLPWFLRWNLRRPPGARTPVAAGSKKMLVHFLAPLLAWSGGVVMPV